MAIHWYQINWYGRADDQDVQGILRQHGGVMVEPPINDADNGYWYAMVVAEDTLPEALSGGNINFRVATYGERILTVLHSVIADAQDMTWLEFLEEHENGVADQTMEICNGYWEDFCQELNIETE